MTESTDLKKMYWHSRRGMLELDLILVPFAEKVLPTMTKDQKQDYARLLLEEDQDLFQWLVKKIPIPDNSLQGIVDVVLAQS
jgi:antitoxin CptB